MYPNTNIYIEKDIKKDLLFLYENTKNKSLRNAIIIAKYNNDIRIKKMGFYLAKIYKLSFDGKLPFSLSQMYFSVTD